MKKIPPVMNSQTLLDFVLHRAAKVSTTDSKPYFKKRNTAVKKMQTISDSLISKINNTIKSFPTFENLDPFKKEIIDIRFSIDRIRKSLGMVGGTVRAIRSISGSTIRSLNHSKTPEEISRHFNSGIGRLSSLIDKLNNYLEFLEEVRRTLNRTPTIDFDVFTVVVAGYPNVGKSALVGALSTASPEVAQYPFTTHEVTIGHLVRDQGWAKKNIQIVDTPGILDRPPVKHNDYEKAAFSAMKNLAHCILFVMDISEFCGYTVEEQESLLESVKGEYRDIPLILALSKVDIPGYNFQEYAENNKNEEGDEWFRFSSVSGHGIEDLKQLLFERESKFSAV